MSVCGYGRVALPLAGAGYEVEGLDLSENLIEAARHVAAAERLQVAFTVGSMTPTAVRIVVLRCLICLRSAFNEVLNTDDQARMISEIWRVLRRGGFALVERMLSESQARRRLRAARAARPRASRCLASR
jgi:SAM-dependent methyltransferase